MQVRRHVTTLLCQILGARDAMQVYESTTSVCSVTADKELTGNKQLSKGCIATHIAHLINAAFLLTLLNDKGCIATHIAEGLGEGCRACCNWVAD